MVIGNAIIAPMITFGQKRVINNEGVKLEYETRKELGNLTSNYQKWAKDIIGAALFISLIIVIYHVANNGKYGKGKQAVISWVIAVIIYTIAININLT